MRFLLTPFELMVRGVNRVRRNLYRRGVLRARRLHRPVISVGNITAGGAGKTPAVIALCQHLTRHGLEVAVLTRGYGKRDPSFTGIVREFDADKFGDEPVLIKRSVNVDVLVGVNRYQIAHGFDTDVFILDDGFQHLQIERDLDIVIDAPGRFYREGRSALAHAGLVVKRRLRLIIPDDVRRVPLFAFSGLADNDQFFSSLRAEGLNVTGTRGFPDHHRYTGADLAAIRRDAAGSMLVTTEKDAVKIDDPSIQPLHADFVFDADVLETALRVAEGAAAAPEAVAGERRAKRRKNAILERIEYVAYRGLSAIAGSLSDETTHRWGSRMGALASVVLRGRDRLAMANLRAVFPDRTPRELRATLDACWRHFGREALVALQMQKLSLQQVAERCPAENTHILEEAIARGKGTLILSGHWGAWEVGGLAIMSLIGNVHSVARPLDNELLERDLQKLRARTGAEVVDRRKAARTLLRALADNGVVVLLPDQAVLPREGILVPFLGRPAWTTPAPARMALRADSTIVFAFCVPEGPGHRLVFQESIRASDYAENENAADMLTIKINDVLSRRIADRPELWLWMHDRFKGTAESESRR